MTLELTPSESRWVDHVRDAIVPRLAGSLGERARTAAVVTWWALKEGIFDLPNPLRHNLCTVAGERQIGDLAVCPSGAWQVGVSGIQGGAVTLSDAEAVAKRLYPGLAIPDVLERSARDAGLDAATVAEVRSSTGELRKAWLLRDGAIGFTLQRPFVERGCLSGDHAWCYGGWDSARRFAGDPARVRHVIGELEAQMRGGSGLGVVALLLGLVGGAVYVATRDARSG